MPEARASLLLEFLILLGSLLFKFFILLLTSGWTCQLIRKSKIGIEFFLQLQLCKLHLTSSNILNHPTSKVGEVPTAILNRLFILQLIFHFIICRQSLSKTFSYSDIQSFTAQLALFPFSDESTLTGLERSFTSMVLYLLTYAYKIQFNFSSFTWKTWNLHYYTSSINYL